MNKFLPFVFLVAFASLFGLASIIFEVDPDLAAWYIFALLVILVFAVIFGFLGLILYFVRTRFYKRYSVDWYIKTSFKMAFFVAIFGATLATLIILRQVSTFNIILLILAVSLLAIYSFLGKKN